jgi:ABC-type cobalamin/Fe3+-siderophores transport system ATPase subunit
VNAPSIEPQPAVSVATGAGRIAAPPAIIRLDGVDAVYRDRPALRGISLGIARGERVALVGPNGAGKSTLLRVIAGTLPPRAGTVQLDGDPIGRLDRSAIARRVAVVPQLTALPFAARVEEVVGLGRLPHEAALRGQRAEDHAAVAAAIERVGIGHLVGRDARELSLGERQLVLIALAVAQAAPVMLLDEPTVHLDLRHRVEAMELLVDLNERDGATVLTVIHDLQLAARFFPRIVLIEQGRIVADGPPEVALHASRIRGVFGIEPVLAGLGV